MLATRGATALAAALTTTVVGLLTLQIVILLLGIAAFAFVATVLLAFHLARPLGRRGAWQLEVAEGTPRVPNGAEASVRLTLRNAGAERLHAVVVDTLPQALEVVEGRAQLPVDLAPGASTELAYRVRARARGRWEIGPTLAVTSAPLDLAFDEVVIGPARPLLVTATNLTPRSAPSGLGLYTRVRGRLALRHRGFGSEFRSLRAYELSDDIRHVAWRRSTPERLLVREFDQENRQDYLLVFDVTPASLVGEAGTTSLDRAAEAGGIVAGFVERSAEDRVGLLTYSNGVRQFLRPARGATHFRRVAENLALLAPLEGRFDLAAVLDEAVRRLRVHSHLFVFSTLAEPLGDLHAAHARFVGRGHQLYLFAGRAAGFYAAPADADARTAFRWAQSVETDRLERRLALLSAEGIRTYRYDRRGAVATAAAAYGEIRAWGRAG